MKTFLTALTIIASTYILSSYNVEIKIAETTASANCGMNDPGCNN